MDSERGGGPAGQFDAAVLGEVGEEVVQPRARAVDARDRDEFFVSDGLHHVTLDLHGDGQRFAMQEAAGLDGLAAGVDFQVLHRAIAADLVVHEGQRGLARERVFHGVDHRGGRARGRRGKQRG